MGETKSYSAKASHGRGQVREEAVRTRPRRTRWARNGKDPVIPRLLRQGARQGQQDRMHGWKLCPAEGQISKGGNREGQPHEGGHFGGVEARALYQPGAPASRAGAVGADSGEGQ